MIRLMISIMVILSIFTACEIDNIDNSYNNDAFNGTFVYYCQWLSNDEVYEYSLFQSYDFSGTNIVTYSIDYSSREVGSEEWSRLFSDNNYTDSYEWDSTDTHINIYLDGNIKIRTLPYEFVEDGVLLDGRLYIKQI